MSRQRQETTPAKPGSTIYGFIPIYSVTTVGATFRAEFSYWDTQYEAYGRLTDEGAQIEVDDQLEESEENELAVKAGYQSARAAARSHDRVDSMLEYISDRTKTAPAKVKRAAEQEIEDWIVAKAGKKLANEVLAQWESPTGHFAVRGTSGKIGTRFTCPLAATIANWYVKGGQRVQLDPDEDPPEWRLFDWL